MGGPEGSDEQPSPLEQAYPHVARWVTSQGWIEIGQDDRVPSGQDRSFVRALDIGGMVWEGASSYQSVDAAFQALEAGLAEWMQQQGID